MTSKNKIGKSHIEKLLEDKKKAGEIKRIPKKVFDDTAKAINDGMEELREMYGNKVRNDSQM